MSEDRLRRMVSRRIFSLLRRSLYVLRVDSGSCNGCEIEVFAALIPQYDVERFGVKLVASPRHADALLVTGPVTRQFKPVLKRVYEMVPDPKVVIAVGACGCGGGVWYNSYSIEGGVDKVVPVDVYVPGCPPHPAAILYGVLLALDILKQRIKHIKYSEKSPREEMMKPPAIKAVELRPDILTWEVYRELDITARKYLGYLYGSIILREYLGILKDVGSPEELRIRSEELIKAHGNDPHVREVIELMNDLVVLRLKKGAQALKPRT